MSLWLSCGSAPRTRRGREQPTLPEQDEAIPFDAGVGSALLVGTLGVPRTCVPGVLVTAGNPLVMASRSTAWPRRFGATPVTGWSWSSSSWPFRTASRSPVPGTVR